MTEMVDMFTLACENTMQHKDVLEQLRAEKFDLAMMEIFDACSIGPFDILYFTSNFFK